MSIYDELENKKINAGTYTSPFGSEYYEESYEEYDMIILDDAIDLIKSDRARIREELKGSLCRNYHEDTTTGKSKGCDSCSDCKIINNKLGEKKNG